ncbi:MAG: metal ABC transporter permease [Verrucomicrobia bacterium]|nr:metal ABC transporter permease [Verrucomicrobiota bacterium]
MIEFFTSPVLRAPTIGTMLMSFSAGIVGVIAVLRQRSLVGEALSHATYPGVVLSVILAGFLPEIFFAPTILIGAFLFAFLGMQLLDVLERRLKIHNDAALCLILSLFFGLGILIASRIQVTHGLWYRQALSFIYGQAATMTDIYIVIYGALSVLILGFVVLFYRQLQATSFDPVFCKSIGIPYRLLDQAIYLLLALAIVIGIRSVGVVLMAGMLIAPAVAARPFAKTLAQQLALAGSIGVFSGFIGNVLSYHLSEEKYPLPTGPMILITAALLAFISLFFAPKTGVVVRYIRRRHYEQICRMENALKALWKGLKPTLNPLIRNMLQRRHWIDEKGTLTKAGKERALQIVRLHRLWEVYLVHYMGQKVEKVHRTAEELEHFLTPQLEAELLEILHHPTHDPHQQPIPGGSR